MKSFLLLVTIIAAGAFAAAAQTTGGNIEARTADGRTVILKTDGTWEFKKFERMGITLAAFQSLTDGTLYADAVTVLGSEGRLVSESTVADIAVRMYEWKTKDGQMTAMFQNGRLSSKWQYGLK